MIQAQMNEAIHALQERLARLEAILSEDAVLSSRYFDCERSHTPNAETQNTFEETDRGEGLLRAKSARDLFGKLGI